MKHHLFRHWARGKKHHDNPAPLADPPAPRAITQISPSGGDDTSNIQNQLNSTASAGNTLEFLAGTYHTSPLTVPSNANVQIDSGVSILANSGYTSGQNMWNIGTSNVTITGAGPANCLCQMIRNSTYQGTQMVFRFDGATNASVSGLTCSNAAGDGSYVTRSSNVTVTNCIFTNNMRQGTSVTDQVQHIHYTSCQFNNTNGALPSAGIDIEPNFASGNYVTDVTFTNCSSSNNQGDGILVSLQSLDSTSQPVSIHVLGHISTSDGGGVGTSGGWGGYRGLNSGTTNAGGYILFENCTANLSAFWGAVGRFWANNGAALIFKNLTVTNPHVMGPDTDYNNSAAVAIARGGGATVPSGNVHFLNVTITATNGKTSTYFDFFDSSQPGPYNCRFLPNTLSGASNTSTMGMWNGSPSGAIN